jgi:hypothetical protein
MLFGLLTFGKDAIRDDSSCGFADRIADHRPPMGIDPWPAPDPSKDRNEDISTCSIEVYRRRKKRLHKGFSF